MMESMRPISLAAAFAALSTAACGSPSAPDANWVEVTEHTTCEALRPQFCLGAFGFTVQNDGHFTVGPGEGGTMVTGTVTEAERARLGVDAALVSATLTTSATCEPTQTVPGISDRVDFTDSRVGSVAVYEVGVGSVCYRAGRDQTVKLHTDLAALMAKYYPSPFPTGKSVPL
jgi:hypothetical protein